MREREADDLASSMSPSSRQRTLHTLSEFRPAFRVRRSCGPPFWDFADESSQAIASGLTDLDLVFIEEAFERLLLDYDRAFLRPPASYFC